MLRILGFLRAAPDCVATIKNITPFKSVSRVFQMLVCNTKGKSTPAPDRLTPYIPEESDSLEVKKWEEDFAKAANDIEAINKRNKLLQEKNSQYR